MNRFSHIKPKAQLPASVDEFIAGAEQPQQNKKVKRRISRANILLVGTGKFANKEDTYAKPPILLNLKKELKHDIERYCSGNMQVILNYLIKRGLDDLVAKNERVIEEAE